MKETRILEKMAKGKKITWEERRYLVENNYAKFVTDAMGKTMILNNKGKEILYSFYK